MSEKIENFIDYLADVKGKSNNTAISYRRDLGKLYEFLSRRGVESWEAVTEKDLADFVNYLEGQNFKAASVSRTIACVRTFFHYLASQGMIPRNVSGKMKAPKFEKSMPEILTEEEVALLLEQPDIYTSKGLRDKAMLELLYATGVRVSELLALEMEDADMKSGMLHCRENGKERTIPFGREAKDALEAYLDYGRDALLADAESNLIFVNCRGKEMSRQGFWKILKLYAQKAGIEKEITPHTLRHSFAAHLIDHGADVKSVQTMLGHTTLSATLIYTRISQNHLREEYEKAHPRERVKETINIKPPKEA